MMEPGLQGINSNQESLTGGEDESIQSPQTINVHSALNTTNNYFHRRALRNQEQNEERK